MKIQVKAKSAYGILPVGEGAKWVNVDKEAREVLASIVPGNTYELDKDNFFTTATLVGELKKKASGGGNGKYKKKGNEDTMSKAEWAAKDVRIGRAGVVQAAVIGLSSAGVNVLEEFDKVADLADKMREYTNSSE